MTALSLSNLNASTLSNEVAADDIEEVAADAFGSMIHMISYIVTHDIIHMI